MSAGEKSTHLDEHGRARMVDVAGKEPTRRSAAASAMLRMKPETLSLLTRGELPKGDALPLARAAGIFAAKKTPDLIPLCHSIALSSVDIDFEPDPAAGTVRVLATARATDRTGVEMEALTAAAVAALTIYDMCKSVQRDVEISEIILLEKTGGKSGDYKRSSE